MPLLDESAKRLIDEYDCSPRGPNYNRIATEVYKAGPRIEIHFHRSSKSPYLMG